MRKKKKQKNKLPRKLLMALPVLFLMTNGFAAAGAGNLSDNLIIIEDVIDLTDDNSVEPGELESGPETESESETEIRTEMVTKPETEMITEALTEKVTEPQTELLPGKVTKPQTETELLPEKETELQTEIQTENAAESETETELSSETETETEPPLKEPKEELWELLEQAVHDRIPRPAAAQYLGLDELEQTAAENGLIFELRAGLEEETARNMGISDELRKTSYCRFRVQENPDSRQWMLDLGLVLLNSDLYRVGLYGDREMLTLSLPWLYEKEIGIRSGNLYEQMKDSWASDAAEKIPPEDRDIELNFYPDEQDLNKWRDKLIKFYGYEEDMESRYEELLNAFWDRLICSRTEEEGETVYFAEMEMDATRDLYLGWFDLCYGPMTASGAVTEEELSKARENLEEEFREFGEFISGNPSVCCYARDGKLNRIVCEIPVDTAGAERIVDVDSLEDGNNVTVQTGISEYKVKDSANINFAEESDPKSDGLEFPVRVETDSEGIKVETPTETDVLKKGYLEMEIVFGEKTDEIMSTDISFTIRDENKNLYRSAVFTVTRESPENGSEVRDDLDITVMKGEAGKEAEAVYSSNLVSGVFNPGTGHYDIGFSLTDPETKEISRLTIESRFTEVVPGMSFIWDIDRVKLGFGDKEIGLLEGQICVQAQPADLMQPEDSVMIFDLSKEELAQLGSEISENLSRLAGNEPEEETDREVTVSEEKGTQTGK